MYNKEEEQPTCLMCGKELHGREDKKFCSNHCKDTYNNSRRLRGNRYRNQVMHHLEINHRILSNIIESGRTCADMGEIAQYGFNPSIVSGCTVNEHGRIRLSCFNICYSQSRSRIYHIEKFDVDSILRLQESILG